MEKLYFRKSSTSTKIIYIAFIALFVVFAIICVYPLIWAFLNSIKTMEAYSTDSLWFPEEWMFSDLRFVNYARIFSEFKVACTGIPGKLYYTYFDMLTNSLWILVVHVFVNVASSGLLAYALARFRFPGKNLLYGVVIFANTIPIIGAGPAQYKLAVALNLVNNPYMIWVMWASGFDFAFIVFYGYFRGISGSYSESAKIEGANNWVIFIRIILPQIIPCIVAIAITQAIGIWNNYSISMIYMRDYPNLAYGMYLFKDGTYWIADSMPIYFAAAVISSVPIIILYASTQNLILTNMTAGGLKG